MAFYRSEPDALAELLGEDAGPTEPNSVEWVLHYPATAVTYRRSPHFPLERTLCYGVDGTGCSTLFIAIEDLAKQIGFLGEVPK